jgi:hypothetical protein
MNYLPTDVRLFLCRNDIGIVGRFDCCDSVLKLTFSLIFSSPDHEVVMVRYSDGAMSGVRRRALCVVRRQQLGC